MTSCVTAVTFNFRRCPKTRTDHVIIVVKYVCIRCIRYFVILMKMTLVVTFRIASVCIVIRPFDMFRPLAALMHIHLSNGH